MASFDFDQEYAANFAFSVVKDFPIQLIGEGLSVQGLFMGPWYFYYLVPFYAFFKLHPLGGAVGSVVLGLVIVTAYYYYGNKFFGRPAGLIGSLLRAILFSKIESDWSMVPAYSCELLVLVTWDLLHRFWKRNEKSIPILGFTFGLYTSFHPILFPFYIVFSVLFVIRGSWLSLKMIFLGLAAFLIPNVPLIIFEYFHKFLEVRRLIEMFLNPSSEFVFSLPKLVGYSKLVLGGIHQTLKPSLHPFIFPSLILLLLMTYFSYKRISVWKDSFHLIFLFLSLLIFVLYYYFLPVNFTEYYLLAPITLLFFYFIGIVSYLTRYRVFKFLVIVFLGSVFLLNIKLLADKWSNPGLTTLAHKETIVKTIVDGQSRRRGEFYVSYISLPGWNFGFDYLFKFYECIPQTKEVKEPIYSIVIPKELSPASIDFYSGNIGLILPK